MKYKSSCYVFDRQSGKGVDSDLIYIKMNADVTNDVVDLGFGVSDNFNPLSDDWV